MANQNTYLKNPYIDFYRGVIYRVNKKTFELVKTGYKSGDGYLQFKLNGKMVSVHRYIYEKYHNITLQPDQLINHKNHKRDDNRIENLEVVNSFENQQYRENVVGVYWDKSKNKYKAQIQFNNEKKSLGYFDKFEDAVRKSKETRKFYNENFGAKFNV